MSRITVERFEPTSLAEVGEFLRHEWAAFDGESLGGDDSMRWEKNLQVPETEPGRTRASTPAA